MARRQRRHCPQCDAINISRISAENRVYYICNHCGIEFKKPLIESDETRRFGKSVKH